MGYVIKSGNICVTSFGINSNIADIYLSRSSLPALLPDYDTALALAIAMNFLFPDRAPFYVECTGDCPGSQ